MSSNRVLCTFYDLVYFENDNDRFILATRFAAISRERRHCTTPIRGTYTVHIRHASNRISPSRAVGSSLCLFLQSRMRICAGKVLHLALPLDCIKWMSILSAEWDTTILCFLPNQHHQNKENILCTLKCYTLFVTQLTGTLLT